MDLLRRLSPAAWMTAVIPLVIAAFVGAHIFNMSSVQNIDDHAQRIQIAAARSHLLSTMRGRLHHVGIGATDIDDMLIQLRALPGSDAEEELSRKVELALAEAQADRTRARVRHADHELQTAVDFENARVLEESRAIEAADSRLRNRAPLLDGLAAGFSLLLMLLGIRASRRYARLLQERNRLAERRAEELELFAARVAHDLKNPLGAAALRVMLAQQRLGDDRAKEEMRRVEKSLERMSTIIEGLFDFARVGGERHTEARTNLAALLSEMTADFSLEAKRVDAELIVEPFAAVEIACPPGPLASVLGNLLRNAIKYIGEGQTRRITVRARPRGELVRVEIEDTGPGIPAGSEQSIFEPFVRLGSGKQPGIGLGLPTVKRIVEAYGGTVGVSSRPGRGSRFWFELPAAPSEAEASPQLH
jgi:signal transduction histidine kinase